MTITLKTVKFDLYFSLLIAVGLFAFRHAAQVTNQYLMIVANVLAFGAGLLLIVTTAQWVLFRIHAAQLDRMP